MVMTEQADKQAAARDAEELVQELTKDAWDLRSEAEIHEIEAEQKYLRATLCFDQGDIDEALMLIRSALSLCPGNAKYHYNIGFLYWRKGLIEVALNHYKMFLRYAPADDKDIQTIKDRVKFLEGEIKNRKRPK